MKLARMLRSLALTALLAPAVAAQATWTVDPAAGPGSQFTTIQAAVDAAAEGDRVVLRAGSYAPFEVVGKSLTILSESPARPFVSDLVAQTGAVPVSVRDLAPGQLVRLRGINVFHSVVGTPVAFEVNNCAGTVWIEDSFSDSYAGPSLELKSCAEVVLQRCLFQTNAGIAPPTGDFLGDPGARVRDCADVRAFDCVFRGSHGVLVPGGPLPQGYVHGGSGIEIGGGALRLESCTLLAGNGSANDYAGCLLGGDGGAGLEVAVNSSATLTARATTFQGAPPSTYEVGCSFVPVAGPDLDLRGSTLTVLDGARASWRVESPAYELGTLALVAEGAPGDFVFSWYSFEPAPVLDVAGLGIHLDPFAFYELVNTSLTTGGEEETLLPIPTLSPGWTSGSFVSQALFVGGDGVLRLSGPTWTLVLP